MIKQLSIKTYLFYLINPLMHKQFILDMQKTYPFGELGEVFTEDTKVIVKKVLKFTDEQQKNMIKQMVHFLKAARHDSLLNLQKFLEGNSEVQLYYEYAPFKLQKWIVTVNEELVHSLKEQMLQLAQYLTRSSIKFTFNPQCLGLSSSMGVKYFLNQFSISFQNQQQQFQDLKKEIICFFKDFYCSNTAKEQLQQIKQQCTRLQSVSTNPSISPLDQFISIPQSKIKKNQEKSVSKGIHLSAKVQNSMKKSLQALMRFKRAGNK